MERLNKNQTQRNGEFPFSALSLLVGQQEGFVCGDDLTGAFA